MKAKLNRIVDAQSAMRMNSAQRRKSPCLATDATESGRGAPAATSELYLGADFDHAV
jgi:hypothetical protein